jgi:DNA polymerase-1
MQHIIFEKNTSYEVALLIKTASFRKEGIERAYIHPWKSIGLKPNNVIAFDLQYPQAKKCPAALQKAYLEDLLPILKEEGVKVICVADSDYFKTLTKERKAEVHHGYVLPCAIKNFTDMHVALIPNYQGLFYNPDLQEKIDMDLKAVANFVKGTYKELGTGIIHKAEYLTEYSEIYSALQEIKKYPSLVCDIETLSLNFWETGIVTIGFAIDNHKGIAIWCDDYEKPNHKVRQLLKDFLYTYTGTLIYHGCTFDIKILISTLFMAHLLDEEGKQAGIELLTRKFDCTKLITYLATNSCAGNHLGLKEQAHEFAGNYAEADIKDVRLIEPGKLLKYNLIDCLATWFVHAKHYQTMVDDKQLPIYQDILKPSVRFVLQMELTGMPLHMGNVALARKELEVVLKNCDDVLEASNLMVQFNYLLREQAMNAANAKLKKKVKPITDFDHIKFNANSNPNLQQLLYDFLGFPVIDKTAKKAPAAGADTIRKLIHHTKDPAKLEILDALIEFSAAAIILSTFVTAFEKAVLKADGIHYLHGNFNLGGTVSGRFSSSNPNLQNIPSTGSKYAKIIKACFVAPEGWVFMGADFASLEDRISALTTRDTNKLKVYTDGYDGHCLRAYGYFGNQMPDIVDTVVSINSIKTLYPELRQDSKAPTFLLTYGGTYHGLVSNVGLSKEESQSIELKYHTLYAESDAWVKSKIDQAAIDGYVTVAFGLRVRTPLIKQSMMNTSRTPYESQAEGRTAGNALGQSYGLLNNRAGIDLQERTLASEYRYDILPIAHIHDAQYFLVRDNVEVVEWLNHNLIECMEWQELPEIKHPDVGLGGVLSLFYPSWREEIEIPNDASQDAIKSTIKEALLA